MFAVSTHIKGNEVARENARLFEKIQSINRRKPKRQSRGRRNASHAVRGQTDIIRRNIERLEHTVASIQHQKQLRTGKPLSGQTVSSEAHRSLEMGEKKLMSNSRGMNNKRLTKPGDSTPSQTRRGSTLSNFDDTNKNINADVQFLKTGGVGSDTERLGDAGGGQ